MRARLGILGLALCPALGCSDGGPPPGTSVLLISLDSTRRDLLGEYGRRPAHAPGAATSPRIDRLAREGVLFEDAYATTSWTLPSHVSLLTGRPELVHAVDLDAQRLDASIPTLAEVLRAHGYRTAGFFSGPYLDPRFGFDRGFDRYEAAYGPELSAAAEDAAAAAAELARAGSDRGAVRAAWEASAAAQRALETASHRDVSSARVTDAAIAELERAARGGAPFLLFAHYFDPHYDYVPPPPFDTRFDPDYSGSIDGADFFRNPEVSVPDPESESGRRRVIAERDLEHVQALYEGELAWTDEQVGRLLDALDDLGLADRTLVVVLADHGDEFFEHGGIGHRRTLFEEVVRVPLVMRLPGVLPAGVRVSGPVSLTSVVPTVLDALGIEDPSLVPGSLLPEIDTAGSRRGVLGRIVTLGELVLRVPTTAGEVPVSGELVRVLETYREGAIKVTRERRWTRATEEAPREVAAAIERQSLEMRSEELLRWIDVEAHPDERPEDHSSDFADPRARAALRAFYDLYTELLEERRPGPIEPETDDLLGALRGLGYVGQEARFGALTADELSLPPPGASLLSGE